MHQKISSIVSLLAILAGAAATIIGLHQLGTVPWLSMDWSDPRGWIHSTPPIEALLSVLRLVGLACGWWILVSTCFYLAAALYRASGALRIAAPLTPPFIRALASRMAAGAVAASVLVNATPAWASGDPLPQTAPGSPYPPPIVLLHADSPAPARTPSRTQPFLFPLPWLRPAAVLDSAVDTEQPPDAATTVHPVASRLLETGAAKEYRVVAGDHLWSIARRTLTRALGHPPTTEEIGSYWVDLIEANRERLRSGNPDLIYPGEVLVLPRHRNA